MKVVDDEVNPLEVSNNRGCVIDDDKRSRVVVVSPDKRRRRGGGIDEIFDVIIDRISSHR